MADLGEVAAEVGFGALAEIEEGEWIQLGLDLNSSIEEVRLIEYLALRFGHVDRGSRGDGKPIRRRPQVRERVADVRAEPEVAPQSERSFHTSTATSSTGRAIGGSGLAARTDTASAP